MIHESDSQLIELPNRKEITLCEAVTAFVYGNATDALEQLMLLGCGVEPTEEDSVKAEDLLGQLHGAAYAGCVKFRALKNGEDHSDGHRDIDPLYFGIRRGFNWRHDQIWNQDLSDPVGPSTKDWWDVHLDREQFESLLRDMGVSVQRNANADAPGQLKTYKTGLVGRPSAIHLVLPRARSRLDAGDYPKTLREFSEQLADAVAKAEPLAPRMTPKAIRNNAKLRELWRLRSPPKIIAPS